MGGLQLTSSANQSYYKNYMTEDITFIDGMIFKRNPNAPKFVIGNISIKKAELIAFIQANDNGTEWMNIDVKESKAGKLYCALNNYKKDSEPSRGSEDGNQEYLNQAVDYPENTDDII